MAIKKEIFGLDNNDLTGSAPKITTVDQAYFLYYGSGRQGDVFGTKGAIAMLCLELIAQCPELSACRIGKFGASGTELLTDDEILRAAAEYIYKGGAAVPSFKAGINLSSWRNLAEQKSGGAVA